MGNKINPNSLRLGVIKTWNSIWYAKGDNYKDYLHQDLQIKKMVTKALNPSGLDKIVVKRSESEVAVEVNVARPGVAIGRGGAGIDDLKVQIEKITKIPASIKINEVKKPDISARIVAQSIADGLEKRLPLKPMMVNARTKAIASGARGIKIWVGGRINGASQARVVKEAEGQVPSQTIKANIDYSEIRASVANMGIFGIKVWIYQPKTNN